MCAFPLPLQPVNGQSLAARGVRMGPGSGSQYKKCALHEIFSPVRLITSALHTISVVLCCSVVGIVPIAAAPQQPPAPAAGQNFGEGVTVQMEPVAPYEFRGDLRNLPQLSSSSMPSQRPALPVRHAPAANKSGTAPVTPPGEQAQPSANTVLPLTPAPSPTQNFPGMSSGDSCTGGLCGGGAIPPDPNGDVGPNHYIEAVNQAYAIYSKTGTLLASFTEDSLWSTSGATNTPCGNGNSAGDPIVVYDPLGDRWILAHIGSAFSGGNNPQPTPPFYECIAVSKTGDPVSGGWWFYPLQMDPGGTGKPPAGTFNDYPKFGIWTDCLYMTANGFNGSPFTGAIYASMSRGDLESGAALTWSLGFLSNSPNPSPFTMIPSNLRGVPPPSGTPNYFVSESQVTSFAYEVRKFTAGPNCGGGGTLSAPTNVSQASYAAPPAISVPQPNTSQLLDAIDDRLMQKVQYRNIGGTESLWVVHNVIPTNPGPVQPQWAQIDVTGGTIATAPVQEGIYAPDTTLNRWMGSIAADRQGNAALGYSTSNGTAPNFPSIAYASRLATDSPGTLGSETQLIAGFGSQTVTDPSGAPINRWGDYTGMSVDPSDDCTFWYVNEYYSSSANGASGNWQTRIGSFKFTSCTASTVTLTPPSIAFNNQLVGTTSPTTNVKLTNTGLVTLNITSITLTGTDASQFALVAPTSGLPICSFGPSTIPANSSCLLGVQFAPGSAGSKSASVSVSDDASGSPQTVALTGVGTLPAPAVTFSTASIPFNNQFVGTTSATTNLQLTNSGTATLNVTSITLTGTNPSQFLLVAPTSGTPACSQGASSISAGGFCFLGVRFAPTSAGTQSANVSLTDNASGSPQTVSLSGTGAAPAVTLSSTSIQFNNLAVGTMSATTNVQITSTGSTPLNITSITLAGTDSSQFALVPATSGSPCALGVSSLNPNSSCTVGLQFRPVSSGAKSANVNIADDASGSPQGVILSGTGVGPAVTLSQASIAFGDVNLGLSSATSNVQLTNSGNVTLNIASITLAGTDAVHFVLVTPSAGSPACMGTNSLSAGSSCFVGVQFKPTGTGQRNADIDVIDNAPTTSQMVSLSGVGVDFSVAAAPPATATVAAGTNASFTIDLTTTGGPTQNAIEFSASGNPATTSVTFGPPSVPSGTAPSTTPVTMTVTTMRGSNAWPTARPFPPVHQPALLPYSILCLAFGSTLLLLKRNWLKDKKLIAVCSFGMVLLACAAFQGCARTAVVGGNSTPGGTPAGTSTITVTATGGSISRTTTVSLTVQ